MKQPLILLTLALLTLGSFWFLRQLERSLEPNRADNESREIATAYDVNGHYFDASHQLKYQIHSDRVSEFSHQQGTKIHAPRMQTFGEAAQPQWQGRANTAALSADQNMLLLSGDVQLAQFPDSEDPTFITSQSMVYRVDTQTVTSEQWVKIRNQTMHQTAESFTLDVATKQVNFEGAVKSTHLPRNKK